MRRFILSLLFVAGVAAPAYAVSLRDLVDLSKQGLSDDLLIALVEAEKSVFHLNAADVKSLKEQGLSDRLLIHLLQTPALRPVQEPQLMIADAPRTAPEPARVVIVDRVETVAVPVYVPVAVSGRTHRDRDRAHDRDHDRDGDKAGDDARRRSASPEYWGYGGKLRPDAWKPAGGKRQ